jgi:ABC-2 type transport system ATP-binding protein
MSTGVVVSALSKDFGSLRAVDRLSFEVGRGEVVGFLGPNGAGKSTTMKMITGYLAPSAGGVRVCGADIAREPLTVKRQVGYLPEGAPLYGDMTARRFLDFCARARGLDRAARRTRVGAVVERVELAPVLDQPIEQLSKGFKRRVGLAQAILHDPPVLILDEPTDGLDPNQKHEVRALIQAVAPDKAILISTHILEEVEAVCTRALVIARGRLLADGTPDDLARRSALHGAVQLTLAAPDTDVLDRLAALPEVERVERLSAPAGQARARLLAKDGAAALAPVARALEGGGVRALEITVLSGRLDDVFRALTRQVDGQETRS